MPTKEHQEAVTTSKRDGLSIGDRMKRYEGAAARQLPRRIPVILRVDGRAFHTMTRKKYGKNYSEEFVSEMTVVARELQAEIAGCTFSYSQSDEVSLLLTDYRTIRTDAWFDYDINKMVSISAAIAAVAFHSISGTRVAFDSRAFSVPHDDVVNYFIWRQVDATRNAIQMAGREHFHHKELHKKSCNEIQEMLFQKHGINFNSYKPHRKRGFCVVDGTLDWSPPVFTKDRSYIEKHVDVRED